MTGRSSMRAFLWTSLLLVLMASAPVVHASESAAPEQAVAAKVRYYKVSIGGQQLAGVKDERLPRADGGLEVKNSMRLKMTRDDSSAFAMEVDTTEIYDAARNFVSKTTVTREGGQNTTQTETVKDGKFEYMHNSPGSSGTQTFELPKDFGNEYKLFPEMLAEFEKEKKAVKRSFSAFSDQQQQFVKASFELTGVSQHRHGEQTLDVYDVALTRGDGVNMTGKVDKDNMMVTGTIMGMMQLEWVDEPPFDFEGKGANIDSTYDVACAIKDWRELESMSLTLTLKNDADETPLLADNHYHKVTRKDGRYELELKPTRLPDTFRPLMLPMNAPDEVAPFLKATPNCQSDHEDIKKQAKDIVGDKTNSLDAARAIVDWVGKHFNRVSAGSRGNASALEALKSKDGDCSEHAALTVALARASGIPARTVAGMEYVYHKNKAIVGFHAWAEVYVGQWVAVDATIPETGTSARYIFFGYTEPGHDGGESKITRCMGGMDVEVTRYKCFGKDVVAPPIEQPAKKAANKKKATKK